MNILLVTGQLAEPIVKRYVQESQLNPKVVALPFAVAALMTSRYISRQLKSRGVKGFDLVLVPGLVKGDVSGISEAVGAPTFKGPRHAADLPSMLSLLSEISLSSETPACDIIREELNRRALDALKEVETNKADLLKKPGNIQVGGLAVGRDFPARIVAEIVDVPKLTNEEIRRKATYYAESGADIIDVGMVAGGSQPKDASRAVAVVKKAVDIPVSIDSMNPVEIEAAVSAGADLIISLDAGNIREVSKFASDIPAVVIPTDFRRKIFPRKADDRIKLLEKNIEMARKHGFTTLIADPILDPLITPGTVESIVATYRFRQLHPDTLLFLGVGNVTELLDADSPGVNALLTGVAAELEVSFLLTTEVSDKVRGSVEELSRVSDMMFLAKKRESIPKELGLNLLILKEEKLKEEQFSKNMMEGVQSLDAEQSDEYSADPKGCFKILLDRDKGEIVLLHYHRTNLDKPNLIIRGKKAADVYKTAVKKGLLSTVEHAAYLGAEVEKAEVALKLGRSYIQDTPLF